MGIFSIRKEKRSIDSWLAGVVQYLPVGSYTDSQAMKLAAVYRAVNVIADSVAILPINTYRYDGNWAKKEYGKLWELLNISPDGVISAYTLKRLLVQYLYLKGNCYILITRDTKGQATKLTLLNPDKILPKLDTDTGKIIYTVVGTNQYLPQEDVIHILNYSDNGVVGQSTISYASDALQLNYYAEAHTKGFFEGGANLSGILRPTSQAGNISENMAEKAKTKFLNALNPSLGKSNSVVVLEAGLEYQPITISPKDAQLLEAREFNIFSIAQFFGVPLTKLMITKYSKYGSVEAEQIDFLNTTIQPLIEKIEIEMYRKLYTPAEYASTDLKFDVRNLLRMDSNAQADYYVKMFQVGGKTPNDIRAEIDADFPVTGGNRAFVQQNVQPLDNILNDIKSE